MLTRSTESLADSQGAGISLLGIPAFTVRVFHSESSILLRFDRVIDLLGFFYVKGQYVHPHLLNRLIYEVISARRFPGFLVMQFRLGSGLLCIQG